MFGSCAVDQFSRADQHFTPRGKSGFKIISAQKQKQTKKQKNSYIETSLYLSPKRTARCLLSEEASGRISHCDISGLNPGVTVTQV